MIATMSYFYRDTLFFRREISTRKHLIIIMEKPNNSVRKSGVNGICLTVK